MVVAGFRWAPATLGIILRAHHRGSGGQSPNPSIPAAPPVGCNFVPPSAAAIKAATPRGYAPRVPALTAFAPVGVQGSPTDGSAGEGGISEGFAQAHSNTIDYIVGSPFEVPIWHLKFANGL